MTEFMAETIIKKVKYTSPTSTKTPCKNIEPSPRAINQLIKSGKKKIPKISKISLKYTNIREKKRRRVTPGFSIAMVKESHREAKTHSLRTTIKYRAYSKKKRVITRIIRNIHAIREIRDMLPSKKVYHHQKIYTTYTGFDQKSREWYSASLTDFRHQKVTAFIVLYDDSSRL